MVWYGRFLRARSHLAPALWRSLCVQLFRRQLRTISLHVRLHASLSLRAISLTSQPWSHPQPEASHVDITLLSACILTMIRTLSHLPDCRFELDVTSFQVLEALSQRCHAALLPPRPRLTPEDVGDLKTLEGSARVLYLMVKSRAAGVQIWFPVPLSACQLAAAPGGMKLCDDLEPSTSSDKILVCSRVRLSVPSRPDALQADPLWHAKVPFGQLLLGAWVAVVRPS